VSTLLSNNDYLLLFSYDYDQGWNFVDNFPDFLTIFPDFISIRQFDLVKSQLSHDLYPPLILSQLFYCDAVLHLQLNWNHLLYERCCGLTSKYYNLVPLVHTESMK